MNAQAQHLVKSDVERALSTALPRLESLAGKHIFLSGATGCLGLWLLEYVKVLNEDHGFSLQVSALQRNEHDLLTRAPHLAQFEGLSLLSGDVRYLDGIPADVTHVIHAAALSDRRLLASRPVEVAEVNALGTHRILQAVRLLEDVHNVVLLSSGLVYGTQPLDCERITEQFTGELPSNTVNAVYAESKRFAEAIAVGFASESKIPLSIVRPFAVIGPYQRLDLPWAVTDFIRDSFHGGPIKIMGDGTTVRSIMYAGDFASWVLCACAAKLRGETFNVGSPEAIDLLTLAEKITSHFSPQPDIQLNAGHLGHHPSRLVPEVSHAQNTLGVGFSLNLDQAITQTLTWNRYIRSS